MDKDIEVLLKSIHKIDIINGFSFFRQLSIRRINKKIDKLYRMLAEYEKLTSTEADTVYITTSANEWNKNHSRVRKLEKLKEDILYLAHDIYQAERGYF